MTFADDFATEENSLAGDYPSAFGITFTPKISGIAIAVAGMTLAAYGLINFVNPAQTKYQEVATKKQELQVQLSQIKTGDLQLKLAQIEVDLAETKALKNEVMAMFTNEQDLDTLLLDLNGFVASNQGTLIDYQPEGNATIVEDASLGEGVQGRLKRQGISLTIQGTFLETKEILQDLERLQPLLMLQTISSTVEEKPTAILTSARGEVVPQTQAELKTQIKLDAILPLSEAEIEAAQKAQEASAEGGEQQDSQPEAEAAEQ